MWLGSTKLTDPRMPGARIILYVGIAGAALALGALGIYLFTDEEEQRGAFLVRPSLVANLIPTPRFARGAKAWREYIDPVPNALMRTAVTTSDNTRMLALTWRGGGSTNGYAMRFLELPLTGGEIYVLSIRSRFRSWADHSLLPGREGALSFIAPRTHWWRRTHAIILRTRTQSLRDHTLVFRAPRSGQFRLSVVIDSPGKLEIQRVYLSPHMGPYFDGDSDGATWLGEPGNSISVRTGSSMVQYREPDRSG